MHSERPPVGRRQHLTVLFTDLQGSTPLGRRLEVELFAALLADVRGAWHEAAQRHGGVVARTQGDGALIVFGYPQSGEDDGRRAVETALEVHEAVRAIGERRLPQSDGSLAVRSGIHAGIVWLAEGDLERGRIDLAGDVANVAAHLQQDATRNGILASLDALGPHAALFELGPDPRTEPDHVTVVQVRGRGRAERRFDALAQRGLTPFVGRDDATEALVRCFDAGRDGGSRCVVVQAGPGLGKTRLLEEFVGHRVPEGWQVLRGNCEIFAGAEPLQPFVQMLRSQRLRQRAAPKVQERLLELCSRQPTLLAIDDWQWADDASRRLLVTLLRAPDGPHVLLAARQRDEGTLWMADAPHVTLAPFDLEQTRRVVQRWLPDADPFMAARIHAYAGGVPLYVEELCHSVAAGAAWQAFDGRPGTTGWLGMLVASRMTRLPAADAAVVRAAAVIGNVADVDLLDGVCQPPPDDAMLDRLADADFLYRDPARRAVRFKHGITRDAVYESIGLYERTSLHERVEAMLLERRKADPDAEDASEALAHHAHGCGHWGLAAEFAERAGDKASAVFSMDSARQQYRAALDALDRLPRRGAEQQTRWCALAEKLGFTSVFDPLSLPDGLAVFERATMLARQLGDPTLIARARYWLGYVQYSLGRFRDASIQMREALALAQRIGDARLAVQVEATLGQILAGAAEYGPALALMDRALDDKRRHSRPGGHGVAVGSAYTLACKGHVHADQGDFVKAHAAFDDALRLLGDSIHPVSNSARNWIAISYVWQGRWSEALRVADESARIATDTRALLLLAVSRGVQGYARWCAGDPSGAEQLQESVRWMTARRSDFYASFFNGWLSETAAVAGRRDDLRAFATVVLRRSRDGEHLGEAAACRVLALDAAARGRVAVARAWLTRADASAALRESPREAALNVLAAAAIARQAGDEALACSRVNEARQALRHLDVVAVTPIYAAALPDLDL